VGRMPIEGRVFCLYKAHRDNFVPASHIN
jgi:hypothetical protein